MLNQLTLKTFKCFELLKLPLRPLTILSGSNACGKSSVLQGLVLLYQTMREHEWSKYLLLNGDSIQLGTVSDVVDEVHSRRSFEIGLVDGDSRCYRWVFFGERSEMSMKIENLTINDKTYTQPEKLRYLLPEDQNSTTSIFANRLRRLTYITAERMGPREIYPLEDKQITSVVGSIGEHTVSLLHRNRDENVLEKLVLPTAPPTLLRQVEERMRILFPGFALKVEQVQQANAVILSIRTSDDTEFHRPIHSGFGITQILPIVVAALSSKKESLILIENPEVHLHPAGQALMGQFLADVASAGVQVIVESHSDHVLNGVRRSVKSGSLSSENVAIHFFKKRSPDANDSQVISPTLDKTGNIDVWPEGFFDQFDKDMNHFAGWED
ncbi:MAG: DUF3696 domain-containing protein [Candidatus Nitronauta litoralis]|uniref:DUF3696 domain-containing protein n=1 Tax=Candidatus Nitronauta litoralis TaxID=2705533 RepID=A0A7T0BVM1_9BACT|nr:MAG: DUF3696 domain-containing protein [Candidatus Nitronauta litoralis]